MTLQALPADLLDKLRERFDAAEKADLRRGRELVASGCSNPDGMRDSLAVIAYWEQQRGIVRQRGCCMGGCSVKKIYRHEFTREMVCKQTNETCRVFELRMIVRLFSKKGGRKMANEVATKRVAGELIPQAEMRDIIALDEAVRSGSAMILTAERDGNEMAKALIMARVMKNLKFLLNDRVMGDIMELKGCAAGFKTDETGDKKYSLAQTRDVVILGLLRGLRVTGNEINIIASNLYVTKEGFGRLLRELPGFSDLKIQLGTFVLNQASDGAYVTGRASWKMDGIEDEVTCEKETVSDYRILVRVNKGMGPDAIIGKGESKLLRRIYARITGSELTSDAAADDDESTKEHERQASAKAKSAEESQAEAARQRAERLAAEKAPITRPAQAESITREPSDDEEELKA